ncbi:WDR83 [Scenedesmus sp. PABB004]|nr:WDR83 [Scenedesmus sp. PABB004]
MDDPAPGPGLPSSLVYSLSGHEGAALADRTLRLWNPHKGLGIKVYTGHGYEVRDVSVSVDNSKMASVGGDKQVFLWDVATGGTLRKFRGHDATINTVVHAAGDEVLVTGGADQAVKVWDCRSRNIDPIQTMRDFKDDVTSVVAAGPAILGASVDGTVRRFDVRMGRTYTDELHHPVSALALTHDGLCVLAACLDSCLRLLDIQAGELLASYRGHTHEATRMACALLADDQHVVGCSEDGRVCYWELVDAALVGAFQAHGSVVCGAAAHPTEACLLTCSVDGTVKVWR